MFRDAPYLGTNYRDRLESNNIPGFAKRLENFVPNNGSCEMRKGYTLHYTASSGGTIKSLMEYTGSTRRLFAAGGGEVADATGISGPITTITGLSSDEFESVNFTNGTTNYLICVNGADAIRRFDGTSWNAYGSALTGVSSSTLNHITVHKQRIWFIENNTMNAWYLATGAIEGAATKFPLGAVAKKGGTLLAASGWSVDAGDGPDDYLAWVTTEGEVIVYKGTDPASASTWALVGIFNIDRPISRRCMVKQGADLLIYTETGIVSLMSLLYKTARNATVSDMVRPEIQKRVENARTAFGWELYFYARGGLLLVNAPLLNGDFMQYVRNTTAPDNLGWCEFTNIDANCFGSLDGDLYFGAALGKVYKMDTGYQDDGQDTVGIVEPAWDYFGYQSNKLFKSCRLNIQTSVTPFVRVKMATNYSDTGSITNQPLFNALGAGAAWDTSAWDLVAWAGGDIGWSQTTSIGGYGIVGSLVMRVGSENAPVAMTSYEVAYEPSTHL